MRRWGKSVPSVFVQSEDQEGEIGSSAGIASIMGSAGIAVASADDRAMPTCSSWTH
jgi:hypothetical protein